MLSRRARVHRQKIPLSKPHSSTFSRFECSSQLINYDFIFELPCSRLRCSPSTSCRPRNRARVVEVLRQFVPIQEHRDDLALVVAALCVDAPEAVPGVVHARPHLLLRAFLRTVAPEPPVSDVHVAGAAVVGGSRRAPLLAVGVLGSRCRSRTASCPRSIHRILSAACSLLAIIDCRLVSILSIASSGHEFS